MGPLDASIVNVNLPTIAAAFRAPMTVAGWVPMAYLLVLSSLLLSYGRLGDMWGYRRLFLGGMMLFVAASALCGLSPSLRFLIVARGVQAMAGGMFMAVTPAILTTAFPARERGRALGLNAMMVAFGLALGPSLGGAITQWWGWRWVFYINVPIGLAGFFWARRLLPPDRPRPAQRFDWPGAALAFVALLSFLLWVNRLPGWGLRSRASMGAGLITVAAAAFFLWQEWRTPQPMLQLGLFRNRLFTCPIAAALLNFMSQYTLVFLMPFYLRDYLGMPPGRVGLIMTTFPALVLIAAPLAGALSDRIGTRGLAAVGAGVCAAALAWLALGCWRGDAGGMAAATTGAGRPAEPLWWIVAGLALFGLGTGIFQSPNNSAVMGSVPRERAGTASAVLAVIRNVGMVLGIAVAGALFAARQSHYGAFVPAMRDTLVASALYTSVSAALSLPGLRLESARRRPPAPPPSA
jgi:EmrB/QacA subfamily drug resistance transporter